MYSCIVFAVLLAACAASWVGPNPKHDKSWEAFKADHKKTYDKNEEFYRRMTWESHKYLIDQHNKKADVGVHTYRLAMNEYGDMTHTEFVQTMNGFKGQAPKKSGLKRNLKSAPIPDLPAAVDWRQEGYVTPVKNQGACGSCWAFSSTGALEGQHFKQTGYLVPLSEQNLVDCSFPEGNNGCNGGLMDQAFEYIKENGGIDTEEAYPYEAKEEECRYNRTFKGATDIGFQDVESGDEEALKNASATIGPLSVAIDAGTFRFRFYHSGVFSDADCSSERLDHGVLVVGYGSDEQTGKDYWIVKNSWGPTWGLKGYILMSRNNDNNCGIATQASYPVVSMTVYS